MTRSILRLVCFMLLGTSTATESQPLSPPTLSLRDAVARALDYNARLLDSRDGVERAALSLELARSEFRPQITPNMFGSFGGNDLSNQRYSLDFSQRFTTGTALRATVGSVSSQNQLGNFYTGDTTVQISQPLLRGFGPNVTRRGLTSAESQLQTARRQRALAERQVVIDVASAYYTIVAQKELAAVAEQTVARSRELLAASEARLEVGRVSRLDVFRAQQLAAQSEARLLDARTGVEDARDRLRDLLGYDWDYQFTVEPGIRIPRTSLITTEEAIAQARVNRLELQTALAAVDDAERAVGAARNQLLPQVDINTTFTRRETAPTLRGSFGVNNFQFASFLSVSMPVDRTPQQTALRTAAMTLSRQRRELTRLERSLAREARQAVRQQNRLRQALGLADAQVSFAEQEVELAAFRYQRGLSNNLDVVNAEANLLAGRAGRYEIQELIGTGGMGVLYRAIDPKIANRPVAIKVLRVDDEEMRLRFEREARMIGLLEHPNIVTVYDVGDHDGQPFIAMKFIPGDTLAERIERHPPMPLVERLVLIEQLCDGLAYAHGRGVIHRDIKPVNLMVHEGTGRLMILDFGIARASAQGTGITQIGKLVGTPRFMSPEQLQGNSIDHRSDIFSVGLVLYELLSCRPAFPG